MTIKRTPQQIIGHDAYIQLVFEGYVVTHATPSADPLARLVRYEIISPNVPRGEYVLYSEAAAIITQKNASLQQWQNKWSQTDILRLKAVEQAANTEAPWRNMNSAPIDGTIINVLARYPDARSGYPRYAGFNTDRGVWLEYSRYEPVVIIPWAWRPRLNWPSEGSVK